MQVALIGCGAIGTALLELVQHDADLQVAAIVVPDLVLVGGAVDVINPKLGGAIAAVLATQVSRNPWLPFIAGMAALLLLR